jgi:hypothetical protein
VDDLKEHPKGLPSLTPIQFIPSPRLVPIMPGERAILGIPDSPIEQMTKRQLTQMQPCIFT